MAKKLNVILITIDALRADRLGYMSHKRNVSPNIDALAGESSVFTNAYATGPVTPHSFPSILTSTYPLDYHGPQKIEKPRKLISEVLKKEGFTTAAFHSNPFIGGFFGYNRGWDFFEDLKTPKNFPFLKEKRATIAFKKIFRKITVYFFPQFFLLMSYLRYRVKGPTTHKIKGSFITQIVKDFISSRDLQNESPFFAWIHYMDVHSPYFARDNFPEKPLSFKEYIAGYSGPILACYFSERLKKFFKKYVALARDSYDEGIKYVDGQIGDLINFLKKKGIYDNSIIILTADHGDEFLEHGSGSHRPSLYNELLHIPLLIRIPGRRPETIKDSVSLIDLSPTICAILDIKRDSSFKGKNLFNRSNLPIFHQTGCGKRSGTFSKKIDAMDLPEVRNINQCKLACQYKNWKYILNYDIKKGQEELYNLLIDPKEQQNLASSESEIVFQMRNIIQEFEEKNPPFSL